MLHLRWVLVGSLLLSGCAVPASQTSVTSPETTGQAQCARDYGVWRDVLNFCEYRSGC
jgi:hypothetical protein